MVAAGRLDAHYEHGLHVWDWAALDLDEFTKACMLRLLGRFLAGSETGARAGS